MFKSRNRLCNELDAAKNELIDYKNDLEYLRQRISIINSKYFAVVEENSKLKRELEKQKKIAADNVSLYYDTIQKLKTVMEETNYGKDL